MTSPFVYNGNPPSPNLAAVETRTGSIDHLGNPIFDDTIATELLGQLSDALHAAWNGWEAACKFQDEERQNYFMSVIRLCDDTSKKIKKLQ